MSPHTHTHTHARTRARTCPPPHTHTHTILAAFLLPQFCKPLHILFSFLFPFSLSSPPSSTLSCRWILPPPVQGHAHSAGIARNVGMTRPQKQQLQQRFPPAPSPPLAATAAALSLCLSAAALNQKRKLTRNSLLTTCQQLHCSCLLKSSCRVTCIVRPRRKIGKGKSVPYQ